MPFDPRTPGRPKASKLDARLLALTRLPPEVVEDVARIDAHTGETRVVRLDEYRGFAAEAREPEAGGAVEERRPPARAPSPLLQGILRDGAELSASVLIWFKGDRAQLEALGVKVRSMSGDTATATVPLKELDRLAEHPDVVYVELSRAMFPMLDRSVDEIRARSIRVGGAPAMGTGTVVGVIDVDGIDIYHPDFFATRPEGPRSRIAWLWDQRDEPRGDVAGRAPRPWEYGAEYRGADIDADVASGRPYSIVEARPSVPVGHANHGTAMAGIAAGNGRASEGRYVGVAPEAEIIFVNADFSDAGKVCDALEYIFRRAGDRPCVVNISLGNDVGPHDGTTVVERFIDNIVAAPGRCVVVAAGNSNAERWHAEGSAPASSPGMLELVVPRAMPWGDSIEIWYPGDDRLDVTLIDPRGVRSERVRAPGAEDGEVVTFLRMGQAQIMLTSKVHDARNDDNLIELALQPDRIYGHIADGTWRIELERSAGWPAPAASGPYHAWIHGNTRMHWLQPAERCTVTCPATATAAISVGNYIAREGGRVSATSGRGPTRKGGMKPDLVAPGADIHAPLASSRPTSRERCYAPGFGTSQAAAHVAGLVALLLQRAGGRITTEEVRAALRLSAEPAGPRRAWDPRYGWGRARAPRAALRACPEVRATMVGLGGIAMQPNMEDTMSEQNQRPENITEQGAHSAPANGARRAAGRDPRLQVDLGTYEIYQGETQVGELLVLEDPGDPYNSRRRIEHWGLYSGYEAPSTTNQEATLEFYYVTGQWGNEEDFREHLQEIQGVMYIKAVCEEQDP